MFGTANTAASVLRVPPFSMALNITYAYLVTVSSPDGRSGSQTVLITPMYAGCAELYISSTVTRFNEALRLVIHGSLLAATSLTARWEVFTPLGELVPFKALTPKSKTFIAGDTATQIPFPLSIERGAFTGGRSYVFRLSASPNTDVRLQTFVEITMTANTPPSAGRLTSTPSSGDAFLTLFLIASPGWTADAANFPLSYSFSYSLNRFGSNMTLATASLRAYTTSVLPAGAEESGGNVTLKARAIDIFNSYGSTSTTVRVISAPNTNLTNVLESGLSVAFFTGDINLAFQTINNVRTATPIELLAFHMLTLFYSVPLPLSSETNRHLGRTKFILFFATQCSAV